MINCKCDIFMKVRQHVTAWRKIKKKTREIREKEELQNKGTLGRTADRVL
jgi:hypothetical protein